MSRLPRTRNQAHLGVALSPKMVNQRMADTDLRNQVQLMVDNGQIDDPHFMRALNKVGKGVEISDIGGDHFETVINPPKSERGRERYLETGKVELAPRVRAHGLGESPTTMRAMLAQERMKRTGYTAFNTPAIEPEIERITQILNDGVQLKSINSIGMGGARGPRTSEQKLGIAASLLADVDRGYNRETGAAFNGVALDAGHRVAHSGNPLLSDEPTNLIMQNQYVNRGQAAVERMASQEGREATNTELADGLFKVWMNKIMKDQPLATDGMRKNSPKYKEVMRGIDAKLQDDT